MNKERETFRGVQWTGIVLALSMALALVTLWTLRPETGHGATGVNDPTPGSVFQVAVDADTTGNPTGSGVLLSSLDFSANVPVENTHFIDVIVDEVAVSDGMASFGFNLKTDPNVVKIVSRVYNLYMLPGAFEVVPAPIPDQTGNWRIDAGQLFANVSGEGVLVRIGIECIAAGTSVLDVADDVGGDGIPNILQGVIPGFPNPVLNATDGQIVCGTGQTPTPDPATATPTPDPATATPTPDPATATPTPDPGTATPTPTPGAPTPTATPVASGPATPTPTATATLAASPSSTSTPGGGTETPTPTAGPSLVWGDNNCSGAADPVDSLLTLRHDAGLSADTGGCPDMGETIDVAGASLHPWGDVDCSGDINPIDSLKLLRADAGLSVSQAANCPEIGSTVLIG